jgi:hypothetical protein
MFSCNMISSTSWALYLHVRSFIQGNQTSKGSIHSSSSLTALSHRSLNFSSSADDCLLIYWNKGGMQLASWTYKETYWFSHSGLARREHRLYSLVSANPKIFEVSVAQKKQVSMEYSNWFHSLSGDNSRPSASNAKRASYFWEGITNECIVILFFSMRATIELGASFIFSHYHRLKYSHFRFCNYTEEIRKQKMCLSL